MRFNYIKLIVLGSAMMLTGWVLVFLMVLQVLNSTFLLNFISYGLAVCGLFLGNLGIFSGRENRRKRQKKYNHQDNFLKEQINS